MKRNGEIDLLRFVFSSIIVLHHFDALFPVGLLENGYIGVEFFFLVSGFLMAQHIKKVRAPGTAGELADETWRYMIRKIGSFFPDYLSAMVLQLVIFELILDYQGIRHILSVLLQSIPTITLTFFGLNYPNTALYVGNTWYLSAMIMAMFLLYPVLLRFREFAAKVIFPALALFLLGYMNMTYGFVSPFANWTGFCYGGLLRAVAQIAMGASLSALSDWLVSDHTWQKLSVKRLPKILITLVKYGCYGVAVLFAQGFPVENLHVFLFLGIGIALSFSGAGYMVPDNQLTRYLGKLSLPLFIYHGICRMVCQELFGGVQITIALYAAMVAVTFLACVVMMHVVEKLKKQVSASFLKYTAV